MAGDLSGEIMTSRYGLDDLSGEIMTSSLGDLSGEIMTSVIISVVISGAVSGAQVHVGPGRQPFRCAPAREESKRSGRAEDRKGRLRLHAIQDGHVFKGHRVQKGGTR